jgi:hypothetical protein
VSDSVATVWLADAVMRRPASHTAAPRQMPTKPSARSPEMPRIRRDLPIRFPDRAQNKKERRVQPAVTFLARDGKGRSSGNYPEPRPMYFAGRRAVPPRLRDRLYFFVCARMELARRSVRSGQHDRSACCGSSIAFSATGFVSRG